MSPPEKPAHTSTSVAKSHAHTAEDDFGDFSTQNGQDGFEDVDFGDFQEQARPKTNGGGGGGSNLMDFDDLPLPSKPATKQKGFFALPAVLPSSTKYSSASKPGPYYLAYRAHHISLRPLCQHLRSSPSPSSTLALLFPTATPLSTQADVLLSLLLFLSPNIQPLHDWGFLRQALLAAADRFDSACLVAFEVADSRGDETDMAAAAESSWKVWDAGGGRRDQWECGRVWVEKREVFYETSKWDPLENIVCVQGSLMYHIADRQQDHAAGRGTKCQAARLHTDGRVHHACAGDIQNGRRKGDEGVPTRCHGRAVLLRSGRE